MSPSDVVAFVFKWSLALAASAFIAVLVLSFVGEMVRDLIDEWRR